MCLFTIYYITLANVVLVSALKIISTGIASGGNLLVSALLVKG